MVKKQQQGLEFEVPLVICLVRFDDNVGVSDAAQAHIHGDNAHLSLPWLIAVHVTPSKAPLPYISPEPIYILLCLSLLRPSISNREKITLHFWGKKATHSSHPQY